MRYTNLKYAVLVLMTVFSLVVMACKAPVGDVIFPRPFCLPERPALL